MSVARPVPAALVAAACVLAGCGGGVSAPTRHDVIARGNAICAASLRDIRSIPSPAVGGGSLADLAGFVRRVVPIVDHEVAAFRALPQARSGRSLLRRYIAALAHTRAVYQALAAAAAAGDAAGVSHGLAELRSNPAPALAQRYGLNACGVPAGTGVGPG